MRTLVIKKRIEGRHTHYVHLPFGLIPTVNHLYTTNLCLAEIEYLQSLIASNLSPISTLVCNNIEPWCDTRRFTLDLISPADFIRRCEFRFAEDGSSGYGSVHEFPGITRHTYPAVKLIELVIANLRDEEAGKQRNVLRELQDAENDRDELQSEVMAQFFTEQTTRLMEEWNDLDATIVNKYSPFEHYSNLVKLEIGFCYAWTPAMWRVRFGALIKRSPALTSLVLSGWDQLGKIDKVGNQSSTIQPIRIDAEEAISECFESMSQLTRLKLIDFSVGPGLIKCAKHMAKSIRHLDIVFTKRFLRHFTEASDTWLLLGPLKEFILDTFSQQNHIKRSATIHLHSDLLTELKKNPFFIEEPLLESIKVALKDTKVKVDLLEYIPN